ncbi:hypothetical protein V8G54_016573 [Vigna mungo]|uniref:Uncharacterized protein n=1 Tax=Vigna mungo TaxID=3915 RepID=A0AAQ3NN78_VIGMU
MYSYSGKANIFEGTIDNVTALSDMSFTTVFPAARQLEADFPGWDRESVGQDFSCLKSLAEEDLEESEVEFSRVSCCSGVSSADILFFSVLETNTGSFEVTSQFKSVPEVETSSVWLDTSFFL